MAAQIAWAEGKPSDYMTLQQLQMSFGQGRPKAALALLGNLADGFRKRGLNERADRIIGGVPRLQAELGLIEEAKTLLAQVTPYEDSTDLPVAWAETGDIARADAALKTVREQHPEDTLWQYFRAPQIEAAIALAQNKPEEAIRAASPGVPYDLRSSELLALRGRAYLEAKQYALAAEQFRKVIAHAGDDAFSANIPLAHLGLARTLVGQGDPDAARSEYRKFFDLWKDAEPDVPVLRDAKSEYARLSGRIIQRTGS